MSDPFEPMDQHGELGGGVRVVDKRVEAVEVAHRRHAQLTADRFFLCADVAWGAGFELQKCAVGFA